MIYLKKHLIYTGDSLITALERLNNVPENLTLFVLGKNDKLVGTITDGDIRRGLIKDRTLEKTVDCFMTSEFSFLNDTSYTVDEIRKIRQKGVKLLPVLDKEGKIIRVIDFNRVETVLPVDAILMAGGRGERLRPLTDDIPKPLLKVGDKPIIEHNINRLMKYGICDITITIRYLGEKIIDYFGNGHSKGISISYVKEDTPLGTIGALGLIQDLKHDHLLVMNSDLFTNIDFGDFYETFCNEKADICIATIPYNVDIPYAVLNMQDNAVITGLNEKPRYTYYANAGIYLIKRELIDKIPKNSKTDAPDFITNMINNKLRIIKYPIIGYWIDIGKPEDLKKANEFAKHLK